MFDGLPISNSAADTAKHPGIGQPTTDTSNSNLCPEGPHKRRARGAQCRRVHSQALEIVDSRALRICGGHSDRQFRDTRQDRFGTELSRIASTVRRMSTKERRGANPSIPPRSSTRAPSSLGPLFARNLNRLTECGSSHRRRTEWRPRTMWRKSLEKRRLALDARQSGHAGPMKPNQ